MNGIKKIIYVCCDTSCLANNSRAICEEFERIIEKENINAVVKHTGCMGLCEKGPMIKIEPDDISYFKVRVSDVRDIIDKTILKGETVSRILYFEPSLRRRVKSTKDIAFYNKQVKIALRNVGKIEPTNIDDYIERDGFRALKKALFDMKREDIINEILKSGLRGRGGEALSTGRKWQQCDSINNFPKYVICNGGEGNPGAFTDRSIMEGDPYSILEGMIICAYAIGSNQGFVYIRDEYSLAIKNIDIAIKTARENGFLGENILNSGFDFDIKIVKGGEAFICGESATVVSYIEGDVSKPKAKYTHSAEKGIWGQPTVLNNVETWVNIPVIIHRGGEWFSSIGTENSKGTKVFSLIGKIKNTGLVEVPMGTTLREIIFDIGGGVLNNKKFKAVQIGGPSGGYIPESMLDLSVDFESFKEANAIMGPGGMIVMDERNCIVDMTRYYLDFLLKESCGKCIPCIDGIKKMLEIITGICEGKGEVQDIDRLLEISETVADDSFCGFGKSTSNPVISSIKYFMDEYMEHIVKKRCPAGVCKKLTTFEIVSDRCIGCDACRKGCPANAIIGKSKEIHYIDQDKCMKCGNCTDICRYNAIIVK